MEKLFYKKLHSSRRTYFFNVIKNEQDKVSLSIIESQARKNGQYKRTKINIRKEDLNSFLDILKEAADISDI